MQSLGFSKLTRYQSSILYRSFGSYYTFEYFIWLVYMDIICCVSMEINLIINLHKRLKILRILNKSHFFMAKSVDVLHSTIFIQILVKEITIFWLFEFQCSNILIYCICGNFRDIFIWRFRQWNAFAKYSILKILLFAIFQGLFWKSANFNKLKICKIMNCATFNAGT